MGRGVSREANNLLMLESSFKHVFVALHVFVLIVLLRLFKRCFFPKDADPWEYSKRQKQSCLSFRSLHSYVGDRQETINTFCDILDNMGSEATLNRIKEIGVFWMAWSWLWF